MAAKAPATKARSIQGDGRKRGRQSAASKINQRTLRTAHRRGMRLDKNDYQVVVAMRQNDRTIEETAIILERTYFGTQALYASVGLLLRCFPEVVELITKDSDELTEARIRRKLKAAKEAG